MTAPNGNFVKSHQALAALSELGRISVGGALYCLCDQRQHVTGLFYGWQSD